MSRLRAYLVDDEALAVRRLARLLEETGRVEVVGTTTSAAAAIDVLVSAVVDVLFLDIQMPGLSGFEVLARLSAPPAVVFTTAFDQYALRAFEVNAIDYLLKPVGVRQLDRALGKLEALRRGDGAADRQAELQRTITRLLDELAAPHPPPSRICSRIGDRVLLLDLGEITHFIAKDKLTYASIGGKQYVVDQTIAELEQRLGRAGFLRIHRSVLVNLTMVSELYRWFRGRLVVRLRDPDRTELGVSREHAKQLRDRLNLG